MNELLTMSMSVDPIWFFLLEELIMEALALMVAVDCAFDSSLENRVKTLSYSKLLAFLK